MLWFSAISYSLYKRPQQQSVHLLWDRQHVSRDAGTAPESAQFLNTSPRSSPQHQLMSLLASTMFPVIREAQETHYTLHSIKTDGKLDTPVLLLKSSKTELGYNKTLQQHIYYSPVCLFNLYKTYCC